MVTGRSVIVGPGHLRDEAQADALVGLDADGEHVGLDVRPLLRAEERRRGSVA